MKKKDLVMNKFNYWLAVDELFNKHNTEIFIIIIFQVQRRRKRIRTRNRNLPMKQNQKCQLQLAHVP